MKREIFKDRYEIRESLGQGAFAKVFKAWDMDLQRFVAIKVIKKDLKSKDLFQERFQREFISCSALSHPNIVKTLDYIATEEVTAIVLEYLDGKTLEEKLSRGPLDLDEVLDLGICLSDALDFIHSQGFLHRDIKPGNIMMTFDGRAILMDFNLVYDSSMTALTKTGCVVGTPLFLAPEILKGIDFSPQTDVYALALLLWVSLKGSPPECILMNKNKQPSAFFEELPSIGEELDRLPSSLVRTIDKGVSPKRGNRHASAKELKEELLECKRNQEQVEQVEQADERQETMKIPPKAQPHEPPSKLRVLPLLLLSLSILLLLGSHLRYEVLENASPSVSKEGVKASQSFLGLVGKLKKKGWRDKLAAVCRGQMKRCRTDLQKTWAATPELEQRLNRAQDSAAALFSSSASLSSKTRLYNALAYFRPIDALFVAFDLPRKSQWEPHSPPFIELRVLDEAPVEDWSQWPSAAFKRRLPKDDAFMIAGEDDEEDRPPLYRAREGERTFVLMLDRNWLRECENERASLYLELSSNPPESGLFLRINGGIIVPIWPLRRKRPYRRLHYLLNFPAKLLKQGKNRLHFELMSASPYFSIAQASLHAFVLLPQRLQNKEQQSKSRQLVSARPGEVVKRLQGEKRLTELMDEVQRQGRSALDEAREILEIPSLEPKEVENLFEQQKNLEDRSSLFNSLSLLQKFNGIFVSYGKAPPFPSIERAEEFLRIRELQEAPTEDSEIPIIHRSYNLFERSLVPAQISKEVSENLSIGAIWGRDSHEIEERLEVDKSWLGNCDGRVTLVLAIRIQFPEKLLEIELNENIKIPIWSSRGTKEIRERYFALELPQNLLREGVNTVRAKLYSFTPKRSLRGGAWPEYWVFPGPMKTWKSSFRFRK